MQNRVRTAAMHVLARRSAGQSSSGVPLPPRRLRMGGRHFRDNADFIRSASADAERLTKLVGLNRDSRVLDWGCGAGRLAIGILDHIGEVRAYHGVDVQKPLVSWAQRHITAPNFTFTHVDLANERYNPGGAAVQTIPADDSAYDVFYAYSVFSHLRTDDSRAYFREIARLLDAGGKAFITAFVEEDVEPEAENPEGYGPLAWSGALHCVRFEREFFESLITDAGLEISGFSHGEETDGQSHYILTAPKA